MGERVHDGFAFPLIIFFCSTVMLTIAFRVAGEQKAESPETLHHQFEQFMVEYGKNYASLTEKMMRFNIFQDNLKKIERLMAIEKENVIYGIGPFTDLTSDEFKSMYMGSKVPLDVSHVYKRTMRSFEKPETSSVSLEKLQQTTVKDSAASPGVDKQKSQPVHGSKAVTIALTNPSRKLPGNPILFRRSLKKHAKRRQTNTGVDPGMYWVENKLYLPPDNQGTCGACWAFATVAALEILYARKMRGIVKFSKQQLIDCVKANGGCGGGDPTEALKYMLNGITLESKYPFKGKNGVCKPKIQNVVRLKTYNLVGNDTGKIKNALLLSPLPTSLCMPKELQHYTQGVFDPQNCPSTLDHVAVIVGYVKDAWFIRNTWGPKWGLMVKVNVLN